MLNMALKVKGVGKVVITSNEIVFVHPAVNYSRHNIMGYGWQSSLPNESGLLVEDMPKSKIGLRGMLTHRSYTWVIPGLYVKRW